MARTAAIVVAGGRGERFGAPKQFLTAAGTRLVDHAVAAAGAVCSEVVVVLPEGQVWDGAPVAASVTGGATRSASVRAGADAAIPVIEITDTLKQVSGERVVATVARDNLVAVQTPQAFRLTALRDAHGDAGDATDDAGLVEDNGGTVVIVPGDPRNIKVTTLADLALVAALLEASTP